VKRDDVQIALTWVAATTVCGAGALFADTIEEARRTAFALVLLAIVILVLRTYEVWRRR
jgi:hypothetical protein